MLGEGQRREIATVSGENECMDRMKGDPLFLKGRHWLGVDGE